MILSKIAVHGFKSFAKKAELQFDGKITSVVGPNGCGKTNIVDAIRWGLGEQRASVLRTDKMENVIFGGSRSAKPLGMSEVSITFDNSNHILPIDYNEVVITRRLYRSGESEYLLNKTPVRLKDVKDLLMDTGIGADAYSVIELKMVEDILSEKAEDRRKLLEEAAGVTKYKHRLRAAMRKLDATQSDLLRVNDIIQEVDRAVNSLRRQVQRARRYQKFMEEVKELELTRGSIIFNKLKDEVKPLRERMDALRKEKDGSTTEISKEEADMEAIKAELLEKEKVLIRDREQVSELVSMIHRREGDIRVSRERVNSLKERIERNQKEVEDLIKRKEDQRNHLETAKRDREALQVKITSTGRIFNNKKKELEVYQQGLNLKRLELNSKKKEIISILEEINRLSTEETSRRAKTDNCQGRLERLDEEDAGFRQAIADVRESQKKAEKSLAAAARQRDTLLNQQKSLQKKEDTLRAELERMLEKSYQLKSELDLASGRAAFLRNVIESGEGMPDGGRKLLKAKPKGVMGAMADLIETDPKYTAAIETALGETSRYLLLNDTDGAFGALKELNRSGGGRVAMVCLDRVKKLAALKKPDLPAGLDYEGWADEIASTSPDVAPVLQYLLGDVLVVPDLQTARNVPASVTEGGVRVVTLAGEMVTSWGVQQPGDTGRQDGGMVGRAKRLRELEERVGAIEKEAASLAADIAKNRKEAESVTAGRKEIAQTIEATQRELTEAEKLAAQVKYENDKSEEGLARNVKERNSLLEEIEKSRELLENIRPRMDGLVEQRERIDGAANQIQGDVDKMEEEEERMEEEVHKLNLSMVRLKGEAKNLDFDIERSTLLVKEIDDTIGQRKEESEAAAVEIEERTGDIEKNRTALEADYKQKESMEERLTARDADYQTLKEKLQEREKEVRLVRKSREEAAESLHRMEMEIADLENKAGNLRDRLWEEYEEDVRKIAPPEAMPDLDAMEDEIDDTKRKMKALGGVNLLALEEFDQESERLDFLTQQRDDLLSAEATLKETIKKINQTARDRFEQIFQEVRANFQETYKRFFRGGEADLRLPEDEDPLEAQIEIIARPAGKQFRDLSLLSGGERALTAISLLFALYLVKPSPFCILDEIDAPLDDANVERFTSVLAEFAQKTQFIIVTHNKMTMRASGALYGVTNEEEGISKIVSVKFKDDEQRIVEQVAS
ncbi:chromosome segregation protein SMC [bacterium]|nr:chromosome segregation protein SMC [bacterium]